jgi:hypothetical protein
MRTWALCFSVVVLVWAPGTQATLLGRAVGWGDNYDDKARPPQTSQFVAISGGGDFSLGLRADGSIVQWGAGYGPSPAGTGFKAISAGDMHGLALRADGSIAAWGANLEGECDAPAGSGYKAVAAGRLYSLALTSDGRIAQWGYLSYTNTRPPQEAGFVAIAAGMEHALALRADGSIVGWGENSHGQSTPPAGTGFVAIAAGCYHSLALRADGSIVGWGNNYMWDGQGSNIYCGQATPPPGNDFVAISTGYNHSLALRRNGTIAAWGVDLYGLESPPTAAGYRAIDAGNYHSLALMCYSPYPNPTTWSVRPYVASPEFVSMIAAATTGTGGIEYYFACTAGGGHDSGWQSSRTYTDVGLSRGVTYSYTVKARDLSAESYETVETNVFSASIPSSPPSRAVNPSPAAGAANVNAFVRLGWSDGGGAKMYDVYFGTSPSLTAADLKASGTASTSYEVGWVDLRQTYYWRIDARNVCDTTLGQVWSFTTAPAALAEKSVGPSPADGATGLPAPVTLGWSNSGEGLTFDVYLGTDESLGRDQRIASGIADRTYDCGPLQYQTTYYWRVDTVTPHVTVVGDLWSFATRIQPDGDLTPPAPSPMTWDVPPHATGPTTIAMVATTATDVSGVEYYFACAMGGGHDSGWQSEPTYTDTGLNPATVYGYTVIARDLSTQLNQTRVSETYAATTSAAPGLAAPADFAASDGDFPDRIRLTWGAVSEADGYEICYNNTDDISSAMFLAYVEGAGVTTYDDIFDEPDAVYWYWVRALRATQTSNWSNGDSGFGSLLKADFVVLAKRRVGRTTFEYDCQVVLTNNSTSDLMVSGFDLTGAPANVTLVDASAGGFGTIAPGASVAGTDAVTLRVDRSQLINSSQVTWHINYEALTSGETLELTSVSPLILERQVAGDVSGDAIVNSTDLLIIADQWLSAKASGGIVNFSDFAALAAQWTQATTYQAME